MLHVLLDAGIWGHAITHPVTVLFLLRLWLSACPALVWVASEGGFGQHLLKVGQILLLTFVFIHFLYTLFTVPNISSHCYGSDLGRSCIRN